MTSQSKKILYVSRPIAPPWDEASKNFAYNLAREIALQAPSTDIHLMTASHLPTLPPNIVQEQVYKYSEKDFKVSDKLRSLLFQFMHKNTFDIAHYFFTPTKTNSWLITHILKGRSKTIQTVATVREDLFSDSAIKEMMFGDVITTYSDYTKERLENLGCENVRMIRPGIDTNDYYPREKSLTELEKAHFAKDDFIINFTGEYIRLGAMDTVIESFITVAHTIPSARLSLAVRVKNEKDAQKKKEVIARLKEENVFDKVSFHDSGSYKMSDIYNLCDISIFPVSTMQGKFDVPLAVVEAMACGKPVIVSDLPILQEFTHAGNSIAISRNSAEALSQAIVDLYENPQKRQEIGNNAYSYAHENFTIQKAAREYAAIYDTL